jgi:hypothetical protein
MSGHQAAAAEAVEVTPEPAFRGGCVMSAAGMHFDLAARWRNRDRTFERAIGRHLAILGSIWLLVLCLLVCTRDATTDSPVVEGGVGIVGLAGIVVLLRWFGGGRFWLGFALWLLSFGLCNSLLFIATIAHAFLTGSVAPADQLSTAIFTALGVGVYALCWMGLKRIEPDF